MKNEGLINALRAIGGITIGIGAIASLMMIVEFSKPGMFSNKGLSGTEIVIAIGVAFYHVILGILCFGVAQTLVEVTNTVNMVDSKQRTKDGGQSVSKTKCRNCGKIYDGNLTGQFCEDCGEKL